MKCILVTGATGFLGMHLCRSLQAQGFSPRALVRATSSTQALEDQGIQFQVASLQDGRGLKEILRDVDGVVHAAGGGWVRNPQEYYLNNTETTATLLDAIMKHRPDLERFVLISSMAARGPKNPMGKAEPASHYGKSKAAAEALALAHAPELPLTILRPPAVYGPEDNRLTPLIQSIRRGFTILPRGNGATSWIHVHDCVAAILSLLQEPHPSGLTFEIEDGMPITTEELVAIIAQGIQVSSPHILRLPRWVLMSLAWAAEMQAKAFSKRALLTRDKIRDATGGEWLQDRSPMEERFNWAPTTTFEQSFPWEGVSVCSED